MIVQAIKIEKNRVKVIIDDEEIKLEPSVWAKFRLKKDVVLSKNEYDKLIKANKEALINRKALRFLANTKSVWEFKNYLKTLQADQKHIQTLTNEFKAKGYLNDAYYAKSIILKYQNKYGKTRITNILVEKRIHADLIKELLAFFPNNNLDKALIADCQSIEAINYQQAAKKLLRKYLNLGYESQQIKRVINLNLDKSRFNEGKTIKSYYQQALKKYQEKYQDHQLYLKLKKDLYNKGFSLNEIEKILRSE